MSKRIQILVAAGAAALGAFAISGAVSAGSSTPLTPEEAGNTVVPPTQAAAAVAPAIASMYGVFRRAARSTDEALVHTGSFAARQQGIATAQARLISSPTASWKASVVPSAGGACIFVLTAGMAAPGGGCGTQAEVLAGDLSTSVGGIVAGLVPDGVATMTLSYQDGSSQQLPIVDNGYSAQLPKPIAAVSYAVPNASRVTIPLG